jgi:hypothetical protein
MFKFIEFLRKRPSDTTIRILRTLWWGGLAGLMIYTAPHITLPFSSYYSEYELYIKYALAALFGILAIVFGVLWLCVFQRSVMKKVQMISGVLLILLWSTLSLSLSFNGSKCVGDTTGDTKCASVSLSDYTGTSSAPLSPSVFLILMGIATFIGGLSGKMVTQSCLKYKEVITKIRV